jgi:hypothetical protein
VARERAIDSTDPCPVAFHELAVALKSAVASQLLAAAADLCRCADEGICLRANPFPITDFTQHPRKRNTPGHKFLWSVC